MIAGAVGWWYLGQMNPEGAAGDVQSFTVLETDDLDKVRAATTSDPLHGLGEKVQTQVEEKRRIFDLFKRRGFMGNTLPAHKTTVEEVAPAHTVATPPILSPTALTETPRISVATGAKTNGGTIDLKQLRVHGAPPTPGESHVINLKKNT